jgi:hypothetical protein
MLHLFKRSGLKVSSVTEGNVYRLTMPFETLAPTP